MENNGLPDFFQGSTMQTKGLKVRGALTPGLWLLAAVGPPTLSASFFSNELWIKIVLIGLFVFIVLAVCFVFIYFAIHKTDKLQSEEYQIVNSYMQLRQGKEGYITISEPTVELSSNAYSSKDKADES